jgi:hypothetical protein
MAEAGETLYDYSRERCRNRGCGEKSLTDSFKEWTYVANEDISPRRPAFPSARRLRRPGYAGAGGGHTSATGADGVPWGEPHVRRERRVFDAHLVRDERDLLFGRWCLVGRQSDFRQSILRRTHHEQQLLSYLYRLGR